MSIHRFHMKCDKCGRPSPEYSSWPSCQDCMADTCPDCDVPAARSEDESNVTICKECELLQREGESEE